MTSENYRKVILDASALIAYILQERGWETIQNLISKSIMSSVNVSEVAKYFIEKKDVQIEQIKRTMNQLIDEVIVFDEDQAYICADLIRYTKQYGLSQADRACISLALSTGYPIYTTDKAWNKLTIPNLNINVIR
jgi:PIN domain nuclease of toxin-antitoxin system